MTLSSDPEVTRSLIFYAGTGVWLRKVLSVLLGVPLTDAHIPSDAGCEQPKSAQQGKTESYFHLIGPHIYSEVTINPLQADIPWPAENGKVIIHFSHSPNREHLNWTLRHHLATM